MIYTALPYSCDMSLLTVIESPLFSRYWPDYWTAEQHSDFVAYIAGTPEAGGRDPRLWWMPEGALVG